MSLVFRLQSNPLVGKLTTKYLLPLGTRQVGDDVVFFNFGYEEDPPMALPLAQSDELVVSMHSAPTLMSGPASIGPASMFIGPASWLPPS